MEGYEHLFGILATFVCLVNILFGLWVLDSDSAKDLRTILFQSLLGKMRKRDAMI